MNTEKYDIDKYTPEELQEKVEALQEDMAEAEATGN